MIDTNIVQLSELDWRVLDGAETGVRAGGDSFAAYGHVACRRGGRRSGDIPSLAARSRHDRCVIGRFSLSWSTLSRPRATFA